jgi:hypothetical protein
VFPGAETTAKLVTLCRTYELWVGAPNRMRMTLQVCSEVPKILFRACFDSKVCTTANGKTRVRVSWERCRDGRFVKDTEKAEAVGVTGKGPAQDVYTSGACVAKGYFLEWERVGGRVAVKQNLYGKAGSGVGKREEAQIGRTVKGKDQRSRIEYWIEGCRLGSEYSGRRLIFTV